MKTPNQEEFRKEFLAFAQGRPKNLIADIDEELSLRAKSLKKYESFDPATPLIESLIVKIRASLRRLEDIKEILTYKPTGTFAE